MYGVDGLALVSDPAEVRRRASVNSADVRALPAGRDFARPGLWMWAPPAVTCVSFAFVLVRPAGERGGRGRGSIGLVLLMQHAIRVWLVPRRVLRFTPGMAKSPLRPVRRAVQTGARTRSTAKPSSTKTAVKARAIGERLVARAMGRPDKMLTETPVGAASASPMRKRRARESPPVKSKKTKGTVEPRKNPLAQTATRAMVAVREKRCLETRLRREGAKKKVQRNER